MEYARCYTDKILDMSMCCLMTSCDRFCDLSIELLWSTSPLFITGFSRILTQPIVACTLLMLVFR
jgi:hypothetical protein